MNKLPVFQEHSVLALLNFTSKRIKRKLFLQMHGSPFSFFLSSFYHLGFMDYSMLLYEYGFINNFFFLQKMSEDWRIEKLTFLKVYNNQKFCIGIFKICRLI